MLFLSAWQNTPTDLRSHQFSFIIPLNERFSRSTLLLHVVQLQENAQNTMIQLLLHTTTPISPTQPYSLEEGAAEETLSPTAEYTLATSPSSPQPTLLYQRTLTLQFLSHLFTHLRQASVRHPHPRWLLRFPLFI
jgi:hypothetical protein